ncbi:MAG: glycosyltransferase family 4 protein [Methanotrichaceae archaeon]
MKIAYFSTEYPPLIYGGLGVYVDCISRELTELGEKISVFAWGNGRLKRHEDVQGTRVFRETPVPMREGLEVFFSHETLAWGSGLNFLADLLAYNQLSAADVIESGPYDLCVAHDWLGLSGGMAVKNKGIPMIYHVHGLEIGRSKHPNIQLVNLEKKGSEVADAVITVSESMKQELVGMGVPTDKIYVCYHGVDADFFDPDRVDPNRLQALKDRYGIVEGDIIILFVGRLEPVKGVIQLIQAMSTVVNKHPNAKLLIVGKGSLEEQVRAYSEEFITLVTDFLEPVEKMYHYALADLCVFPSLYEPFGIVALEAAAMAKPAVVGARGTSGLREIVENPATQKPTGVHINAHDPADIAWGINLALEDPGRLKEWGKNARARVLDLFTWRKAAEKTLEIYRKVITSPS